MFYFGKQGGEKKVGPFLKILQGVQNDVFTESTRRLYFSPDGSDTAANLKCKCRAQKVIDYYTSEISAVVLMN